MNISLVIICTIITGLMLMKYILLSSGSFVAIGKVIIFSFNCLLSPVLMTAGKHGLVPGNLGYGWDVLVLVSLTFPGK